MLPASPACSVKGRCAAILTRSVLAALRAACGFWWPLDRAGPLGIVAPRRQVDGAEKQGGPRSATTQGRAGA